MRSARQTKRGSGNLTRDFLRKCSTRRLIRTEKRASTQQSEAIHIVCELAAFFSKNKTAYFCVRQGKQKETPEI